MVLFQIPPLSRRMFVINTTRVLCCWKCNFLRVFVFEPNTELIKKSGVQEREVVFNSNTAFSVSSTEQQQQASFCCYRKKVAYIACRAVGDIFWPLPESSTCFFHRDTVKTIVTNSNNVFLYFCFMYLVFIHLRIFCAFLRSFSSFTFLSWSWWFDVFVIRTWIETSPNLSIT